MSQRQDPFYNLTHAATGTAPSLEAIRKIVRDAVHRELNPEPLSGEPLQPLINRSHIGVEVSFVDFDGQEYRGVLYPTKVDK